MTHHAELRFIFTPQRSPELLNLADSRTGTIASFPDLVFSCEAWRPPQLKFELKQALDENIYSLTMRSFSGPQLYLEDSLRQRDWFAHRLRIPGDKAGLQELFRVVLAVGDGVARDTLRCLLQQDKQKWLVQAPLGKSESDREATTWQRLESRIDSAVPVTEAVQGLSDKELSYQPLVRSCATLVRYTVLLTAWRMIDRGHTDGVNLEKLPEAELSQVEGWMKTAAHADLRRLFLSAPAALRFLTRNPQAVPARIPEQLHAAALLMHRDGKPREIRYGRKAIRPYTATGVNMVD